MSTVTPCLRIWPWHTARFLTAGETAGRLPKRLKNGERGRNRTFNLLIKSQLLCQLSYAPWEECSFSGLVNDLAETAAASDRGALIVSHRRLSSQPRRVVSAL